MTDEQLDEIEKLAKAMAGARYHAPDDCPEGRFMALACNYALPLVKALREARERCDTLQLIADAKSHDAGVYARRMEQAQIAGREARAEVERLRAALRVTP